jgi:hypothetical protein
MFLSKEDAEKQRQLEKLIDWEVSKQLTWAVVFLTTILGLASVLGTGLLKNFVDFSDFPSIMISYVKIPLVVIYFTLLIFCFDISFYRLVCSLSICRNFIEMLPSDFQKKQIIEKAMFGWFYKIFVKKKCKNEFAIRGEILWPLVIIGDILFVLALFF